MTHGRDFFSRLNPNSVLNLGIYISGILLISSFFVELKGVEIINFRLICGIILLFSIIYKEIDYWIDIFINKEKILNWIYILIRLLYIITLILILYIAI